MLLRLPRLVAYTFLATTLCAQGAKPCPDRRPDEGEGPFKRMVIRGATLIDGTGGPPRGPVNIVISGNRISSIGRGAVPKPDKTIDARGMYILPGFVDMHAHTGGTGKAPNVEYCYKLWLAHGVTTVRGVSLGRHDWVENERARSDKNEIVAPRIFNYQRPRAHDPEAARKWVREMAAKGIDGLKLGAYEPAVMEALIDEAHKHGLGTVAHLGQDGVAQMNAIDAARLGLDSVTHYYGHFEALLKDYQIQPWPVDHNHGNEYDRFSQVARLWDKIHAPGSPQWEAYLNEQLALGTVFNPTMTIYSANRDVMRNRAAEWHAAYTLPSMWDFFTPSKRSHGSYFFKWSTADEVAWRNFYRVWMRLINDYKKMGGRITAGSDPGFIYDIWGFSYIEELEMLQEAGLHPLEVIQCATRNCAQTLMDPKGKPIEFGVVKRGMLADLVICPENPLADFKTLFGTGVERLNEETGEPERRGGVRWTVKDGIVYDAHKLLADVRAMVVEQKQQRAAKKGADGGGK
ncbi:MAG: amidohydrolase [Planctomycetota bacterium]|nr:amidohydrolase [Planctomycetota bacterium]